MNTPSLEEQLEVEAYVLDRPIERPDTDIKKAIKYVIGYLLISFLLALISFCLLSKFGVFNLLPKKLLQFFNDHIALEYVSYFILAYIITGIFCLRKFLIGAIKLYQHYADEDVRRRCVCKPTCSEYAIIVLRKYGVVIGLYKIYIRLFKTCCGTVYKIDEPTLFKKKNK